MPENIFIPLPHFNRVQVDLKEKVKIQISFIRKKKNFEAEWIGTILGQRKEIQKFENKLDYIHDQTLSKKVKGLGT